MKKLWTHALSTIVALGIAYSSSGCKISCKSRPTGDVPAEVKIDNVYFSEFPAKDNYTGRVCLYKENGDFVGYFSEITRDNFALEFRVKIDDPNMIRKVRQGWGKYEEDFSPEEKPELKEKEEITLAMNGPGPSWLEKRPYQIEVTDGLGNVTEHKFTLDEITKRHKLHHIVRKVEGKCPSLKP